MPSVPICIDGFSELGECESHSQAVEWNHSCCRLLHNYNTILSFPLICTIFLSISCYFSSQSAPSDENAFKGW